MSNLAKAIEENTAAIRELTVIITLANKPLVQANLPALVDMRALADIRPGKLTYHELREAAADENLKADAPPSAPIAAPELTYEKDVKPWAIKLAAKDKQALLATLTMFGVKKGSEVEDQASLLSHIKAALDE